MGDQNNPFMKGGEKSKSSPGRKPNTPNFDQVLAAVERGEYDEDLHELLHAINGRNEARREHVMRLVTEIFGDDAVIEFTKGGSEDGDMVTRSRMGTAPEAPGLFEQTEDQPVPADVANPSEPSDNGSAAEENLDTRLDEVEARMEQEDQGGAIVPDPAQKQEVPLSELPIEQRSAQVGGLSPSDMGD